MGTNWRHIREPRPWHTPVALGDAGIQVSYRAPTHPSLPSSFTGTLYMPFYLGIVETFETRYFSISSPAFCLFLSQVAIRPRPDQVSPVTGLRNFGFTPAG